MWRRVTDACKRTHVDSKLVLQWLRRLDKRAGLERPAEFYSNVHNMDELCRIAESYSRELFADKKIAVPAGVSGAVRHAIEFINGNYKKPISLQDAAEAAGVNPAYLSYLFKQEMEIGFSNYLQERRMECAKELLCTTNYKIKDVASEAGFNDYHYFSKTFKKLNDCSPADYRREHSQ